MKLNITLFGALPFRRVSKTAKRQRRTHLKKTAPTITSRYMEEHSSEQIRHGVMKDVCSRLHQRISAHGHIIRERSWMVRNSTKME